MKVFGPRMKVSIRPSVESAGWLTESAKLVICTHSFREGAGGVRFSHRNAPTAASNTATPDKIAATGREERARAGTAAFEEEDSLPDADSSLSSSKASLTSPI